MNPTEIHQALLSRKIPLRDAQNYIFRIFEDLSPTDLEILKQNITAEEDDLLDLTDLVSDVFGPLGKQPILDLFNRKSMMLPPDYHRVIVMSDFDKTIFYKGEIVTPVANMIIKLTNNCQTVPVFLTARPSFIENFTIKTKKKILREAGIERFSFASGTWEGARLVIKSKILPILSERKNVRNKALLEFARAKFDRYEKIKECFPFHKFIFIGDDTEGDPLFAKMLVESNYSSEAFISMMSESPPIPVVMNPRIHYCQFHI